jgi:tRNA(Ile2)-agmatinylcytidine synthase
MYLAVDDTDSLQGMCTTYLALRLIDALDADLIGPPRLVRLNPAVPWKTRGNGSICLRFGVGGGRADPIGAFRGEDVRCFSRLRNEVDPEALLEDAFRVVKEFSAEGRNTNPGLVVSRCKPPSDIYWKGVRTIMGREDVMGWLDANAHYRSLGNGRGLIGATCGMAWRPADRTYELLAYRAEERWGTRREVDPLSVREMDASYPSTFNNLDPDNGSIAIVPSSPCPVLFGIRGDDRHDLAGAMSTIRSERPDGWVEFLTNQGTDDHIIRSPLALRPCSSYALQGEVSVGPRTVKGGHVILRLSTSLGALDCAAYEPSKEFRRTVLLLREGDHIEVYGELRDDPRTLNLEKMRVIDLATVREKVSNPLCPACGRRMKSVGRDAGYRCRDCGTKAREGETIDLKRMLEAGWHEPPVCSRRHLSKPLKRMRSSSKVV